MKSKLKKYLIVLLTYSVLVSCSFGQNNEQSLAPIKVANNQFIYHYISQKNLDTLNYDFSLNNTRRPFSFKLNNPNSDYAQDTVTEIWSVERIRNFEEKINSRATFLDMTTRERMNSLEPAFQDYCKQGNMKDRLATINHFSENSDVRGNDVLLSGLNSFSSRRPFDYFMLYGNDSIKRETIKIILNRIPKIGPYYFKNLAPLLINENSEAYYKAMHLFRTNIDTIQSKPKRKAYKQDYIKYVAPEMARVGGVKIVDDVLNTVDYIFKTNKSYYVQQHFRNDVKTVFVALFRFHKIEQALINKISTRLKKQGINLKELIQNNTTTIYQLDLDSLVAKAKKSDLLKNNLSKNQRFQIAIDYTYSYNIEPSSFLKNIPVIFSYKSTHFASGHLVTYRTPPYDDMMNKFMAAAITDIPDFYTATYLRKDRYGDPIYALYLGNKYEGFVLETTDTEDSHFNHEAVYLLFNTVLKHKNIEKRFSFKANESKYRYEVTYAKPNAVESFLNSIGKTIVDIKYE